MSCARSLAAALILLAPLPGVSQDTGLAPDTFATLQAERDIEALRAEIAALRLRRARDEQDLDHLYNPPEPPTPAAVQPAVPPAAPEPESEPEPGPEAPPPQYPPLAPELPMLVRTFGPYAVIRWGPLTYTLQAGEPLGAGWTLQDFTATYAILASPEAQVIASAGRQQGAN